jgi:hypothetical protein
MAAGQRDIPVLLAPGSGATVRAPGEFMYLAFADREILAIVTGQDGTQSRLKMVTGDFTKPDGGIEEVELVNPDPDNACAVTVIIGAGEFDRKIIQGEVTITPGIRGADGQFVDDTRSTVRLRVALGNITPQSYTAGQLIGEINMDAQGLDKTNAPTVLDDGRVLVCDYDGDNWHVNNDFPGGAWEPLPANLGHGTGQQIGPEIWVPEGQDLPVVGARVVYRVYDAATYAHRRDIVTEVPWEGIPANPNVRSLVTLPGDRIGVLSGTSGDDVFITDRAGALVERLPVDGPNFMLVRNNILHVCTGTMRPTGLQLFNATTLAPVSDSEQQFPVNNTNTDAAAITRDGVLYAQFSSGAEMLREYSVANITISASGSVTSCAGGGFLKSSPIDTQAEIYTQRLDDGRVLMSGEILRAALEIYTGRYMPANYLDYVYRVRAENLNGISPRTVDSGGKSFLAAGIPDDASGTFPQTLEITLREGLL